VFVDRKYLPKGEGEEETKSIYSMITNFITMSKVTIKVEAETHKKLLEIVSKLQLKKRRRVTIDEAIRELIGKCGEFI